MLNPWPDLPNFKSWKQFQRFNKWKKETFSKPINSSDEPMVQEINRRILENIEEAHQLGMF